MRHLIRESERAAREGRQIVIFPEGTRSAAGTLRPLQPGIAAIAARTKLPVIPAITDSGRYWGRRAFRKRPGTIRIALLPSLEADLGRDRLLRDLQSALATDLPDPVDNSVGSTPLSFAGERRHYP